MHVHLPKPLHGWREFAGEVGIIVVAIMLALAAEYLLEQQHWHHQAEATSDAIKTELLSAAVVGYERRAIQPCLQSTIDDLADKVQDGRGDWKAMPLRLTRGGKEDTTPGLRFAYRPPSRLLTSDAWQNAIATGTLNHLPSKRVDELSAIYNQIASLRELQDGEASAATRLAPLAFDGHMDDRARADMIASIAEVDRINGLMALVSSQMIEAIAALKLGYPAVTAKRAATEVVESQHGRRGACVIQPPFNLS